MGDKLIVLKFENSLRDTLTQKSKNNTVIYNLFNDCQTRYTIQNGHNTELKNIVGIVPPDEHIFYQYIKNLSL